MIADGKEIVFAGAGILWGATTFFRGLRIWREDHSSRPKRKTQLPVSLITGFALILGCSAYLALSVRDSFQ